MISLRFLTLLTFLLAIAGCSSPVAPGSLRNASSGASLLLPKDVLYTFQSDKPLDKRYYTGLLAGQYVAELEDEQGTYFRGQGTCVVWADVPEKQQRMVAQGGIWIRKGDGKPRYRIYRYLGTDGVQPRQGVPGAPASQIPGTTASSPPARNVDPTVTIPIATAVPVKASPIQTGLGAGLGAGIAAGIVALTAHMDDGKIAFQRPDPPADAFEGRVVRP